MQLTQTAIDKTHGNYIQQAKRCRFNYSRCKKE